MKVSSSISTNKWCPSCTAFPGGKLISLMVTRHRIQCKLHQGEWVVLSAWEKYVHTCSKVAV